MRRGSVYLAVLGAAAIVAVLGLSAIVVARIQLRVANAQTESVRAKVTAQSMLEVVILRVSALANWRTTHTNNVWSTVETIGDCSFKYKFVDEIDGNLANDATQNVRLHVWGQSGPAVRIQSVCLAPPPGTANLLSNPGMEQVALTVPLKWISHPDGTLETTTSNVHAGTYSARLYNRSGPSSGIRQDFEQALQSGAAYTLQAYMRSSQSTSGRLSLVAVSTGSGTQTSSVTAALTVNSWTLVSGSVTPNWSGTLLDAWIHMNTTTGSAELRLDNGSVTLSSNGTMIPIAGTWRREILP